MKRVLAAALVVVLLAGLAVTGIAVARRLAPPPAGPAGTTTAGTWSYWFDFDGTRRTYVLHVPAGLDAAVPVPLLIELHGGGGTGDRIDRLTGFYAIADREKFVVVAPSGTGRAWNDGRIAGRAEKGGATREADDVGFISALIDRIESQTSIDPQRVYVTGMSNGAIMSGRLACRLADRIAAVAQVAGTAAPEVARDCDPGRPVPIMEIHGTADPLVPYGGGTVATRLGGRGDVVSVDDWAAGWVARNGDDATPQVTSVAADTTVRTWHGATPRSDVVFYRVSGAGHTWPGGMQYLPRRIIGSTSGGFDASEVIWAFLSAHRLD
jgi:polyhydroxybutyrate depolymerase